MRMLSVLVSRSKVDFITVANGCAFELSASVPCSRLSQSITAHMAEALELLDMPVFIHG